MKAVLAAVSLFAASAQAGTVLWNGIFNSTTTTADFDKWSWSNQIEPWQWYIHGNSPTSAYLDVSPDHKNPADTSSAQGVRTRLDSTAFWNGQNMARTEIIPQTSKNIGSGHLYYHFSIKTSSTNPPNPRFEHQIAFFESHFTELKYGLLSGASGTSDNTLRWMVGGVTQWSTQLTANTWYNFVYDIDFSANRVGLWTSTGGAALQQVVTGVSGSTSTNSADFHIGVLRLPNGGTDNAPFDFFWSGIYVEEGPITTDVAGPFPGQGGTAPPTTQPPTTQPPTTQPPTTQPPTTQPPTTQPPTTQPPTTQPPTTVTPPGPTQTQWGQCGGNGYTGPTVCAAPFTCKEVSPPWYSQCQ